MQTIATTECQPHALGMQAALEYLADPANRHKPDNPYPDNPTAHEMWDECFYRECSDYLAAVHQL